MKLHCLLAIVGCLAGLGGLLPAAHAQVPDEVVQTLKLKIDMDLEQAIKEMVKPELLAREWLGEWPIPTTSKSGGQIEDEARRMLTLEATEKFPFSLAEKFQEEARTRFKPAQRGDKVTVRYKDNRPEFSGLFRGWDGVKTLLIENQRIAKSDLTDESLAQFDEAIADTMSRRFLEQKKQELAKQRVDFMDQMREERLRQLYYQDGFMRIYGKWMPRKQFFAEKLDAYSKAMRERLRPLIQTKHYYAAGYVLYDGDWIVATEAKVRRQQDSFDDTELQDELDELLRDPVVAIQQEGAAAPAP